MTFAFIELHVKYNTYLLVVSLPVCLAVLSGELCVNFAQLAVEFSVNMPFTVVSSSSKD